MQEDVTPPMNNGAYLDNAFQACAYGEKDIVEWLLRHGARPDLLDVFELTPIDEAKRNGNKEILAMLEYSLSEEP